MRRPMTDARLSLTCSALAAVVATSCAAQTPTPPRIHNVVLVHGAFADGSGWKPVYEILIKDGFHVSIVQPPLSGLAQDVAATRRVLAQQDGPAVLVGHSYGGAIITEAGVDPHVAALVYIAAHAPDSGESQADNAKRCPALGRTAIVPVGDGYMQIDPARYHAEFAADVPPDEAEFEARAQSPTAAEAFSTPITEAAWRTKPSWYMVAGADHIINPDLERMYATRAKSRQVVEVPGASHSVFRTHPREVAALIETAAREAGAMH
jgi:pimeloyl-ACP methyl ester carboxylesterase